MKNQNTILRKLTLLSFLITVSVNAQQVIDSPATLKQACETSPGNIVSVNQSIKVSLPIINATPTVINCPCSLVLLNDSKVEFEHVNIQFNGAFSVQSSNKGEVKATKSALKATNINFVLGGTDSQINTSQSVITANAGNINFNLGNQSKMELYGTANTVSLNATGQVYISAGERFTASIADMIVKGDSGIQLHLNGFEGLLKNEKVNYISNNGSILINATGSKSKYEVGESSFTFANKTDILFKGAESGLKLNEIRFQSPSFNVGALNGVTIVAGELANSNGKIEMSQISTGLINGGLSVLASVNGEKGSVSLSKSNITFGGDVLIESGTLGSTEVKENRITSSTKITAKTGLNGSCIASPNFALTAPIINACVLAAAKMALPNTSSFSIYPNPSTAEMVNIKFEESSLKNIEIYNSNGNLVSKKMNVSNDQIELKNLNKGLYIVKVLNIESNTTETKKLLVN